MTLSTIGGDFHIILLKELSFWICSFLLILLVLISEKDYSSLIIYLPNEFYCQVPMTSIREINFSILSVYFVPLCCIGLIYFGIILYIRRRNNSFSIIFTLDSLSTWLDDNFYLIFID
ncbi:hypothetical protein I4U23_017613 [Adineta vaga]|nr:hypothetical protein I4U23_017613 [Adineta vaga]